MSLRAPKILKIFGGPLVGLAMFMLVGGHWAALQAIAWSRMVVGYSQDAGSLAAGFERTFSGQYPCAMCKKIAAEKQQEQRETPILVKAENKIFGIVAPRAVVAIPSVRRHAYPPLQDVRFASRSDRPPTPVPIGA